MDCRKNKYMRLIEDFVSEDLVSGEGLPKIDKDQPQRLKTGMPKVEPKIYKRASQDGGDGDTNVNVSMGGGGLPGGEPEGMTEPEIEITEPEASEEPDTDVGTDEGEPGSEPELGSEEEEEEEPQ